MSEDVKICSICGDDYTGFGNNATPVNDGRCCDSCNGIVITARLKAMGRAMMRKRGADAKRH